ncbi:restriction endonuclease [Cypionkella sp. TWP1-2-1b2]|uniref:restriction endonuclease n=1 Tax=Cypionkella sp. TWP1-2-1b2 TaxID=2804675 RepID=UPI003CE76242
MEYEKMCANLLQKSGWATQTTPTNGDQGVDLIAKKDNLVWAFRCKLYASQVGNFAVQEVAAGKLHYKADRAAVIAPNSFTSSARALAQSNNVVLLHHDDLLKLKTR